MALTVCGFLDLLGSVDLKLVKNFKEKRSNMAVKSWYLSVIDSQTHKPVFNKMFFTAPDMNKFMKAEVLEEKYPKPQYYIVKENY
jgi:hypothetical protein